MNVVVTGHLGYIGSLVWSALSNIPGINLIGVDLKESNDIENFNLSHHFINKVDVLVHLAALTSVVESANNPYSYYENNCYKYAQLIKNIKPERIIYASSFAIYDEQQEINPLSVYGSTKYEGEFITKRGTPNHLILRFANPIGVHRGIHTLENLNLTSYSNLLNKITMTKLVNAVLPVHQVEGMVRDFYPAKWISEVIYANIISDVRGIHHIASGKPIEVVPLINKLAEELQFYVRPTEAPEGTSKGFDTSHLDLSLVRYTIPNFDEYDAFEYIKSKFPEYLEIFGKTL